MSIHEIPLEQFCLNWLRENGWAHAYGTGIVLESGEINVDIRQQRLSQ